MRKLTEIVKNYSIGEMLWVFGSPALVVGESLLVLLSEPDLVTGLGVIFDYARWSVVCGAILSILKK
jgi:hypothetical protein